MTKKKGSHWPSLQHRRTPSTCRITTGKRIYLDATGTGIYLDEVHRVKCTLPALDFEEGGAAMLSREVIQTFKIFLTSYLGTLNFVY